MSYVVLTVVEGGMDTNDEVRRRRLLTLARMTPGGLAAVADAAGQSPAHLDQITKGTLLPMKADGTRSKRSLGDATARQIEAAHGLQPGWLDWPLDAVNYQTYALLSELDKGALQGFVQEKMSALQNMESLSITTGERSIKAGKSSHTHVYGSRTMGGNAKETPPHETALSRGLTVKVGAKHESNKPDKVSKQRTN